MNDENAVQGQDDMATAGRLGHEVVAKVHAMLTEQGVTYREIKHEPTNTSEKSAAARGDSSLNIGGKALVMKPGEEFHLFVLSASAKVDNAAIRHYFGVKKLRFASADELMEQAGLVPGSVPPFGKPILPYQLFADPSMLAEQEIAFNTGTLTDSIVMGVEDWKRIAQPKVFQFSKP